ncbi:unnamed protein product [Pleuronectes platessa]|uniref:Uncharacterized protein n=1 Tax=Pleuronectes platessa TaxID=8262 RepID=A0A9N7VKB5_PLEPL|nr:unnamed protein product [Pleuronectes platessa]
MTFRIACQYRLRGRRTFGLKPSILKNSCRGTTASFPTGCFTTWYGTCTIMHRKALGRAGAHTAQHIRAHHQKRAAQPAGEVDTQRRRRKSLRVIKDTSHHPEQPALPAGLWSGIQDSLDSHHQTEE